MASIHRPVVVNVWPSPITKGNRVTVKGAEDFELEFQKKKMPASVTMSALSETQATYFHTGRAVGTEAGFSSTLNGLVRIASSSTRTSPMEYQRSFRFLARHRRNKSTNLGFRFAGREPKSGSSFMTEARTSDTSSPWNACLPVSIS